MKVATIASKELLDLLREKTILVAIVVQFIVAGTSGFLVIGLAALADPSEVGATVSGQVAYVGEDEGFGLVLARQTTLRPVFVDALEAWDGFAESRYLGVIEENNISGVQRVTITLGQDEIQATPILSQMRGALEQYEQHLRNQRSDRLVHELAFFEPKVPAEAKNYGFVHSTLIPLLILTPVFLAGAVVGDAFTQESRTKTLLLLRSAPVSPRHILTGKLLVPVLLVPAQVGLWLLLLRLNGTQIPGFHWLLLLSIILATIASAIGLLVAAFVQQEGGAQAAYAVAVILLGFGAVSLPRDPLNLIGLASTNLLDFAAWQTVAWLIATALALLLAATTLAARRMSRDEL